MGSVNSRVSGWSALPVMPSWPRWCNRWCRPQRLNRFHVSVRPRLGPMLDVVDLDPGASAAGDAALAEVAVHHQAAGAVRDHRGGAPDADGHVVAHPHRLHGGVAQEPIAHRRRHGNAVGEAGDGRLGVGDVDVQVHPEALPTAVASPHPENVRPPRRGRPTRTPRSPAWKRASLASRSAASTVAPPPDRPWRTGGSGRRRRCGTSTAPASSTRRRRASVSKG